MLKTFKLTDGACVEAIIIDRSVYRITTFKNESLAFDVTNYLDLSSSDVLKILTNMLPKFLYCEPGEMLWFDIVISRPDDLHVTIVNFIEQFKKGTVSVYIDKEIFENLLNTFEEHEIKQ